MRERLRRIIKSQQFFPSWYGVCLNPFFIARRGLGLGIKKYATELTGRLLDVGCGLKPYRAMFDVDEYIGLDLDTEFSRERSVADSFYDGERFPFEDESFDSVLCNQVLEHVFNPDEFLSEIRRILRPGGRLLLTVPFVWDEHEKPHDFARYTSFGLKSLMERNGFVVEVQDKLGADASVIFQLFAGYIYKPWESRTVLVRLIITVLIITPITVLGIVAARLFPCNSDLYLDNILIAKVSG